MLRRNWPVAIKHAPLLLATLLALSYPPASAQTTLPDSDIPRDIRNLHIPLSNSERAYLASLPPLRLGIDPHWEPMAFVNSKGEPSGITADYLHYIEKSLHIRLQVVPSRSWSDTLRLADGGNVDLIAAIPDYHPLRTPFVLSDAYLSYPVVIVTKDSAPFIGGLDDLGGSRVAAVRDAVVNAPSSPLPQDIRRVDVDTAELGLRAVAAGDAYAYLGSLGVVDRVVRERYAGNLRIAAPTGYIEDLKFGVRPSLAPLVPLINRVLDAIPDQQREQIQNSWLSTHFSLGISPHTLWRVLTPIAAVTLLFIVILAWIIVRLRREIRQRRWTENELRFQTQFQKMLMNTVPIPVFVKDIEGRYLAVNPAYEEALGVRAEHVLGKTIDASAHVGQADTAKLSAISNEVMRTGQQATGEVQFDGPDGAKRAAIYWLRLCRSEDGTPRALLGAFVDVSQEREKTRALAAAKAEAEELSHSKDIFLATVSHEIRTPMSGVVGILQLMDRDRLAADDRHLLDMARNAAEILMRILNDILDFAKSQQHELQLEHAPFDVRQAIAHAAGIIAPEIERKGLRLETSVDPALAPRHLGDAHRLGQILLNLLGNAVKFTDNGSVALKVDVDDIKGIDGMEGIDEAGVGPGRPSGSGIQRLRFRIVDTGIGIAPQDQQQLFSPFMQGDAYTSRRYGGTGLGLAICKQLVTAMDGGIALQSVPGAGTTVSFDILLPPIYFDTADADAGIADRDGDLVSTAAPASAASAASAARQPGRDGRRDNSAPDEHDDNGKDGSDLAAFPRVLLVEDQPLNRELLLRQMQHIGHTACDTAGNGVEALAEMACRAYSLVITDCAMPVMDGLALIAEIRRRETGGAAGTDDVDICRPGKRHRTTIFALTADITNQLHDRCLAAGADAVLIKPVSPEQLHALLQRFGIMSAASPATTAGLDAASIPAERQIELWEKLKQSLSEDLDALRQALEAGDLMRAKECAHRILSAASWYGLNDIIGAAAALEEAYDDNDIDDDELAALRRAVSALNDTN
jgi:two-component system sensor histidine kinase EvgS